MNHQLKFFGYLLSLLTNKRANCSKFEVEVWNKNIRYETLVLNSLIW